MDEARARMMIAEHYANVGIDEVKVHEIYKEDAILEFPQGRERIKGKADMYAFRTAYPAKVEVRIWRTTFSGDTWINEGLITYDGGEPMNTVSIWQMEGEKIAHETIYIMDPWDTPEWRKPWVETMTDF